jgi:hypothetical protein
VNDAEDALVVGLLEAADAITLIDIDDFEIDHGTLRYEML